jgi:SAM-dependent methyltransferase
MSVRALSFGAVAKSYERFRPGYPEELFDAVAAYAGAPIRTALEIGAGTGKATRLFAAHGVAVTATDPDPGMLAELRGNVPTSVRTVQAAFEDLDRALEPGETFGFVYAASALHWTVAEGRWPRVAALLEPRGVFACFGGAFELADPALDEAVRTARAPFLGSDDVGSPDGTPPDARMQWPGTELQRSELFGDVRQVVVERRPALSAEDYVGYLSTVSAYLQLPHADRERVFDAIARVLPETVEINADVIGHLARRVRQDSHRAGG